MNVAIITCNEYECQVIANELNRYEDVKISGAFTKARTGIEVCTKKPVDFLICDLEMPDLDGFEVLSAINNSEKGARTKVILTSMFSNDLMMTTAAAMGAFYFMPKPYSISNLHRNMQRFLRIEKRLMSNDDVCGEIQLCNNLNNKDIGTEINRILLLSDIIQSAKGYKYLYSAIKIAVDNPDAIEAITKYIYPDVAKKYRSSPEGIERSIRHVITKAWERDEMRSINCSPEYELVFKQRPTNSAYISTVALCIRGKIYNELFI